MNGLINNLPFQLLWIPPNISNSCKYRIKTVHSTWTQRASGHKQMWTRRWWNKKEKWPPAPSQRACVSVQNHFHFFHFLASSAGQLAPHRTAPPRLQTVTTASFTHDSCSPWRSEVAAGEEVGGDCAAAVLWLLLLKGKRHGRVNKKKKKHKEAEKNCVPFTAGEKKQESARWYTSTWRWRFGTPGRASTCWVLLASFSPWCRSCNVKVIAAQHDKTISLSLMLTAPFRAMKTK